MQLKVNQILLNKPKVDLIKYAIEGKAMVEIEDLDDHEEHVRN